MDVVYLIRAGSNKQLRYSLRSLANLAHDRVWIFGGWPSYVTNVNLVEVPRIGGSRYEHTSRSLIAASSHPEVSDEFVLMNDDFYIVRPVERVGCFHRGEIGQSVDRRTTNHYSRNRLVIGDWLRAHSYPALDYDLHIPMVMIKSGVLEMAELQAPKIPAAVFTRTVYGNLHAIGGTQLSDPKIRTKDQTWDPDTEFLSTSDMTFAHGLVGSYLREMFSEPCPYERGSHERQRASHPDRDVAPALR